MTSKPLQILVSGDVQGRYKQIFSRVTSIQEKKGTFDLLLCVGDFFGNCREEWNSYIEGKLKVPISTLILGPSSQRTCSYYTEKEGAELCENVTYLGKRGIFTGSSGLRIAYLSGIEGTGGTEGNASCFSTEEIKNFINLTAANSKSQQVDILITSQWPKGIEKYASRPDMEYGSQESSLLISRLALALKPRYHFAGLNGIFYERQPYRNHQVLSKESHHVTRFIGLAKVGNVEKKRYLYAFSIIPMKLMDRKELIRHPEDCTESPFSTLISNQDWEQTDEENFGVTQYFFNMKSSDSKKKRPSQVDEAAEGSSRKRERKTQIPSGPCWFCLRGTQVEKHLVVSVGMQTYLALAKGGLVPDHVLILPIGHYQSTVSAPSEVSDEAEKYKLVLKKFYKNQGKTVVFFERNYKTSHLQIQVVPIPEEGMANIMDAFLSTAEEESIELNEIPKHTDLKQILPVGAPYFFVEFSTGEKLLHQVSKRFPLHFGRDVLASPSLLNMPDRVDWKKCTLNKEEETDYALEFKKAFRPFDFNF